MNLDANATEPLRPAARAAVLAALDMGGNPSSIHADGRAARRLLEDSRRIVAARFDRRPAEVVFTAGGTEANAFAIAGLRQGRRVLVGATEHAAVLAAALAAAPDPAPGAAPIPVLRDGTVDLAALAASLRDGPPALVCLMAANNETGVIHPLPEIAALCRAHGALWHCDAVQAAGRIPLDTTLPDSVALSGHKLGGPAGAGVLLLRPGISLPPLIAGGGQERGRRGGTEPLAAIAGLAAALAACDCSAEQPRLAAMRDAIVAGAVGPYGAAGPAAPAGTPAATEPPTSFPGTGGPAATATAPAADARAVGPPGRAARPPERAGVRHGPHLAGAGAARLPNTALLVLPGVSAETQVIALDLAGLRVSAGAACSSGKVARSHVLHAMGYGADAACGIRVSLPWNAPDDAPARFLAAWWAMRDRLARHAA